MKKNNVLVTGAGGFIGSHLVEKLVELGYRVRAFIRYNSRNNWGWLENSIYRDKIEVYSGDIRDFDSVYDVMRDCDTVYHLAALIGIPYSYISPLAYIKTNIEGAYNILQSAKQLGPENIIITSTSETYGSAKYVPIDEAHPKAPQSPYAATKAAADQIALSYNKSFNLPVKVIRPFNTYGPRQSARAIIPSIVVQALTNDKIYLGSLSPTRDFTYVEDIVNGFIKAAESKRCIGEVINLGSGFEISVGDLADKVLSLMEKNVKIISDPKRIRPLQSEVERLCADTTKAKTLFAWKPRVSFDKGLKNTIEWIANHMEIYKANIYNI
jgi:dTDP-glucose 4,6-dehydratase